MILPLVLTLTVECPQRGDLSGLIFRMRVTSGTKNLYYIYFPKTSTEGTARLEAKDFRGQFDDYADMFMMDYNGSVDAASDVVGFELYDSRLMLNAQDQISRWPLCKYERTVWKSRQEKIDYFLSCRNREFYFFEQSLRIPLDGLIRLTLGKKS